MSHRLISAGMLLLAGAAATAAAAEFRLESAAVAPGSTIALDQVFDSYGCSGRNVSPVLHWSDPPSGTKSFAVTVYDPDARGGAGWWHWLVYNIPAAVHELPMGAGNAGGRLPDGAAEARSDYGKAAYSGPCPPKGDKPHHYVFTVYALRSASLDLSPNAAASIVGPAISASQLGSASFTALYGR